MPLQTSTVSVPRANGKGVMESYFVKSEGIGPLPGLVVIHEIYGLNDNIRGIAQRFAEQGYGALAVDLFSNRNRAVCMVQLIHGMLIRPLNNAMLSDLQSTLSFLRRQPGVDPGRTGVVGFCMGGGYALQLAVTEKGMKVASAFYGAVPKPLEALAQSCPILGSYPERDFTASGARELDAMLEKHNIPHDIKFYENTMHSFFNHPRTSMEEEDAKDAWQRMLSFFERHLN
ncbi:MAG TPA: dienelactone hydrolase family protein [Anaerolineales bacterium]|nr:dienelactone hydrolase family protein [Anaerolineales bacterium]